MSDIKIVAELEKLKTSFDFEILELKQRNKFCTIRLKCSIPDENRPNQWFIRAIKELDFVASKNDVINSFQLGKKNDNCSYYIFQQIPLKYEYWDNVIDQTKMAGQILNFVKENNITTTKDIRDFFIGQMVNLSKYTKTGIKRDEKKLLWGRKKTFIKFLYKQGLIDLMGEQKSYCDDDLIRFVIAGNVLHLRKEHCEFLDVEIANGEIPMMMEIYQKVSYDISEVDTTFYDYLDILQNINQKHLWTNAGVKYSS